MCRLAICFVGLFLGNPHHMTKRHIFRSVLVVAASALAVGACSDDTQDSISTDVESAVSAVGDAAGEATDDAAEALARNIATQQGEEQFTNAGHPLDGPLTCTAMTTDDVDAHALSFPERGLEHNSIRVRAEAPGGRATKSPAGGWTTGRKPVGSRHVAPHPL